MYFAAIYKGPACRLNKYIDLEPSHDFYNLKVNPLKGLNSNQNKGASSKGSRHIFSDYTTHLPHHTCDRIVVFLSWIRRLLYCMPVSPARNLSVGWHHSLVDAHADEEQGLEWCVRAFPEIMVFFFSGVNVFFWGGAT